MKVTEIPALLSAQKAYFHTGATHTYQQRIDSLKKLRQAVVSHQRSIGDALKMDLGKGEFESYVGEIGYVLGEIDHTL
ncbi:MAG: aldehyde dehydrogenase family protein, partial [Halobacteriovoraceae bacterium]|nr:aldehyde dehydrogenase family protein [Halobacteriovoraceae bacterium]